MSHPAYRQALHQLSWDTGHGNRPTNPTPEP
jgi:hypothetical protein